MLFYISFVQILYSNGYRKDIGNIYQKLLLTFYIIDYTHLICFCIQ